MTLVSCHCEAERSEAVAIAKSLDNNEITTSCATPRNDKYVSEAHRKELDVLTSYRLNDFKKKIAFTLAEVLITLGIIGVVAAMTIPTLIANYQEKQTISRLQKTYATLKNAFEMGKVEYGDYSMWSWMREEETDETTEKFYNKYIFPHLKVSKKCIPATKECFPENTYAANGYNWNGYSQLGSAANHIAFVLPDGTQVLTWGVAKHDNWYPHVWLYVDLNGFNKPNTFGKDIFVMYFSPNNRVDVSGHLDDDSNFVSDKSFNIGGGLKLYGEDSGLSLEELMEPGTRIIDNLVSQNTVPVACSSEDFGYVCGAVIKLNGWKFPDGYLK